MKNSIFKYLFVWRWNKFSKVNVPGHKVNNLQISRLTYLSIAGIIFMGGASWNKLIFFA